MLNVKNFSEHCINVHPTFFEQKYLLALSGGLDSTVLFHLLNHTSVNFCVAHINYNLRGKDSLDDVKFVEDLCQKYQIPFYLKTVNTLSLKTNRTSLQMLCRELRYAFFTEIMQENAIDFLLTAHHANDVLESFFLNLFRGSGIKGLSSIPEKTNTIIRPLLPFTHSEILEFAQTQKIAYREDSSNKKSLYKRNFLRLEVFPLLNKKFPSWQKKTSESITYLKEINAYLQKQLQEDFERLFSTHQNGYKVKKKDLKELENFQSHYFFSRFGFSTIEEILKILEAKTSSHFQNAAYTLYIDRTFVYILPHDNKEKEEEYVLHKSNITITAPIYLKMENAQYIDENAQFSLDADLIDFPLKIRKIQTGDSFQPNGMNGNKKVAKFLRDEKIPLHEKKHIWLLCDNKNQILSVLKLRQDQRYLAHSLTKNYLNFYL